MHLSVGAIVDSVLYSSRDCKSSCAGCVCEGDQDHTHKDTPKRTQHRAMSVLCRTPIVRAVFMDRLCFFMSFCFSFVFFFVFFVLLVGFHTPKHTPHPPLVGLVDYCCFVVT